MDRRELRKDALPALAVALVCAALIFPGLGASSLDGDEALYAAVVLDSAADGKLLPLTLHGDAYFNKPPGGFALELTATRLFGTSELALRLPSALFGLATCLCLYRIGSRWFGRLAGGIAAVALASTSTALSRHAFRGATFDALLLLLTTVAISAALSAILERERLVRAGWSCAALATVALKLLAGPATVAGSLLFAGAAAAATRRDRTPLRRAAIAAGTLLAAAVALIAIWGVATRDQHLLEVFRHDLFRRLTGNLPRVPQRPWFYYFGRIATDFGPLLLLPLLFALRPFREWVAATGDRIERLAAVAGWGLAMPLLLAPFGSKLNWYVLPSYPGIALAIGAGAAAILDRMSGARLQAVRVGLAVLLAVQGVAGWKAGRARDRVHPLAALAGGLAVRENVRLYVDPGIGYQFDPDDVATRPLADLHGIEEYYYLRRLGQGREVSWPPQGGAPGKCDLVFRSGAGPEAGAAPADAVRLRAWRQGPDLLLSDPCGLARGAKSQKS